MTDFIRHAYDLAAQRQITDQGELSRLLRDPAPAWVHMQADDPGSAAWISEQLDYLPETVREALTSTMSRPRALKVGDGVLLILRGLNTNAGAEPEDMVSLRLWVEEARVVSMSIRELATIRNLAAALDAGQGPETAETLLRVVIDGLTDKLSAHIDALDAEGDELEKAILDAADPSLRARVSDIRGDLVDLRQFILPQRDALARLAVMELPFCGEEVRLRLAEAQENANRALETAESLRDRLVVLKDELSAALDEKLNRNLYRLSMISAVFLPLGVLTGLMGINLAGMPGAGWPWAFWVFTGMLVLVAVLQVAILRRLNWW